MPLPGEELVHDHPVDVPVPLDRRGPREGGPTAGPTAGPPTALGRDLFLDRREEPRPPASSPLDPVRPMAEAAAHLLRHVAAAAPLVRPEAPNPPTRPIPSTVPAAPIAPVGSTAPATSTVPAMPTAPAMPNALAVSTTPAATTPPTAPISPTAPIPPTDAPADPALRESVEPGLPTDVWRALESEAGDETLPGDEAEEFEVTEEILMPPAAPAWRRLLAWTVDGSLLLLVPLVALAAATHGAADEDGVALRLVDLLRANGAVQGAAVALAALTAFVYLTLSSFLGGRTPGAALAGLGVVSCASGNPPSLGRAALRAALAVAGTFAFCAGPLWALVDGRGQALHDKLAGTVVMADR